MPHAREISYSAIWPPTLRRVSPWFYSSRVNLTTSSLTWLFPSRCIRLRIPFCLMWGCVRHQGGIRAQQLLSWRPHIVEHGGSPGLIKQSGLRYVKFVLVQIYNLRLPHAVDVKSRPPYSPASNLAAYSATSLSTVGITCNWNTTAIPVVGSI